MNISQATVKTLGTQGSLTAHVENPQVTPPGHDYVGDTDTMVMLQLNGEFRIHSTQRIGSGANQLLGFDFIKISAASLPADGQARTFNFPTGATGLWWAHENAGAQAYRAGSGSITVTLDLAERAVGTFSFIGAAGSKDVQVTNGIFDLRGFTTPDSIRLNAPTAGTGNFDGNFVGGPAAGAFSAKEVSLVHYPAQPPVPARFDIQGRVTSDDGLHFKFVAISVNEGATGSTFNLANSTEARVMFFDFPDHGFAYAIAGKLAFISMPGSGVATGTLDCTFQKNDEPAFTFKGSFNVTP